MFVIELILASIGHGRKDKKKVEAAKKPQIKNQPELAERLLETEKTEAYPDEKFAINAHVFKSDESAHRKGH